MDSISVHGPTKLTERSADADLLKAASYGTLPEVMAAVDAGANIEAYSSDYNTALLHAALDNPSVEISKYLVDIGCNMRVMNEDRETVVHGFARRGWLELIEKALAAGCGPNAMDCNHQAPLTVVGPHTEAAELLIREGASAFRYIPSGGTVLDLDTPELLEAALRAGVSVEHSAIGGETMLMLVAREDNADLCRALIGHDADIDAVDNDGIPALVYAAVRGSVQCFSILLEHGARTDFVANDGTTLADVFSNSPSQIIAAYDSWRARDAMTAARTKHPWCVR